MSIPYHEISQADWIQILLSNSNVQTGGSLVGFRGSAFQRGHGLGSIFKSLFRIAAPIAKNVIKSVAKEGLSSAVQVGSDMLEGKNLKESIKERSKGAGNRLLKKGVRSMSRKLQRGSGIGYKTRKRAIKRKKKQVGYGKRKGKRIIDFLGP